MAETKTEKQNWSTNSHVNTEKEEKTKYLKSERKLQQGNSQQNDVLI